LHQQIDDFRPLKIYLNIGEHEGEPMIPDAHKMYEILKAAGMTADQLRFDIVKGEGHSHPTWRKGFRAIYPWILE
jgi:hypothetical protein